MRRKIKRKTSLLKTLTKLIVTFFYSGFLTKAPGTLSSIIAILIGFLINKSYKINAGHIEIFSLIWFIGFFICAFYCFYYIKSFKTQKDPKEVVLDEVFAILLITTSCAIIADILSYQLGKIDYILMLVIFRFFDIKKPFIIGYIDKNSSTATAIMLDDLLAAFFTICLISILIITKAV
jgi:phosphatidylglycerophosphatase A